MRFLRSFALLQVHESCRGGCCHPDCRRTHELAAEPCAGCGDPIGLDRAHMTRGVVAHLECLAAALCTLFAGGGFVRDSSRVGPTSRVDRGVAA
jgi:hypothetical protein